VVKSQASNRDSPSRVQNYNYPWESRTIRSTTLFASPSAVVRILVQSVADVRRPRGGTWNVDGQIVFAADIVSPLAVIASTGGTPRLIDAGNMQGREGGGWPVLLPDGRHFLYVHDRGIPRLVYCRLERQNVATRQARRSLKAYVR